MRKNALIYALLVLLLLAPGSVVLANMASPPAVAWLTLQDETGNPPRLQGVQLIGCGEAACAQPTLLQQYGTCRGQGCLFGPASLSGWQTSFACASYRCYSTVYPNYGGSLFKLAMEFDDRVRVSNVSGPLPDAFGEEMAWTVHVREADLAITPEASVPAASIPYDLFHHSFGWLGLSILVEVVVAGVSLRFFARRDLRGWSSLLVIILLANLATLPIVWLTVPGFGQFQTTGSRLLGVMVLVIEAFYVGLLAVSYRAPRKVRLWAIPVIAVTFLLSSAACLFLLAINHYGSMSLYVQGLPPTAVIVVSEVFAVVAEALLIGLLGRISLRTWWVWAVSLLMNAASFAVGLLIIGRYDW